MTGQELSVRRREVLRILQAASGPLTISAVADQLAVHPNTVRFHLNALVKGGHVQRVRSERKRPGRPPLAFRATRQMNQGAARNYRLLAAILTSSLAGEPASQATASAAGRAWGREMKLQAEPDKQLDAAESTNELVAVLGALGFAPEVRESGGDRYIGLRHCPFLELAETRPNIVCSIHLGLMQGALERWRAPITVDGLEAFVEPDLCLARVGLKGRIE